MVCRAATPPRDPSDDPARVAAALLATKLTRGRLVSPFTAREVYRSEWTGLTEARVMQGALECLEELGWIRPEAVRGDGGRPTRRFHLNPRLGAGAAGMGFLLALALLGNTWNASQNASPERLTSLFPRTPLAAS